MGQITVMAGPERRRRWSDEERLTILSEAFSPGACVSRVADRHGISTGLIYTWRRKLREGCQQAAPAASPEPGFAEAVLVEGGSVTSSVVPPAMVVEFGRGKRVSIFASAPPALAAAALKALR